MNKVMMRLEKLTEFETKLTTQSTLIQQAEKTPTTTIADLRGLIQTRAQTEDEFNKWMVTEFGFGEGPQTLAMILKRVLETSVEPSRIITP